MQPHDSATTPVRLLNRTAWKSDFLQVVSSSGELPMQKALQISVVVLRASVVRAVNDRHNDRGGRAHERGRLADGDGSPTDA
jgi:hypothetical protein